MAYSINSTSFGTYNMFILSSSGALDFPKRLGESEYDWDDDNGVQAYVDAASMFWDGREITLEAYYNGSNMASDLATFRTAYEGTEVTLETTFGNRTVVLKRISTAHVFNSNERAVLRLTFWEPVVDPGTAPGATGGSGPSIGGYDLYQSFGLRVERVSGLEDVKYSKSELTYGDTPTQYAAHRGARRVRIMLTGVYATTAAITTAINGLHAMLRTENLKVFAYRSSNYNVYLADKIKVDVYVVKNIVKFTLTLRIEE